MNRKAKHNLTCKT